MSRNVRAISNEVEEVMIFLTVLETESKVL
jgi:hypothetical protein